MGTRSLTHIYDEWWDKPKLLCTIYRQFDGYPDGHGADLQEFLSSRRLVNGIGTDPETVFNGAGDLAAQLVAHLKMDGDSLSAGNVYIEEPGTSDMGEEWVYTIRVRRDEVHLEVKEKFAGGTFYEGPIEDFVGTARESV